tara:strand:+ start:445 stop:621 length:177 start_codon:yes stop_codon:yes gene_type:complete
MGAARGLGKVLKHIRDKYTHQVPTGPHTDVTRRKVNPSLKKKVRPVKIPKTLKEKIKK